MVWWLGGGSFNPCKNQAFKSQTSPNQGPKFGAYAVLISGSKDGVTLLLWAEVGLSKHLAWTTRLWDSLAYRKVTVSMCQNMDLDPEMHFAFQGFLISGDCDKANTTSTVEFAQSQGERGSNPQKWHLEARIRAGGSVPERVRELLPKMVPPLVLKQSMEGIQEGWLGLSGAEWGVGGRRVGWMHNFVSGSESI